MHLLDEQDEYEFLPEPLITTPISTAEIDDIYTLDQSSSDRWRTFIHVDQWHPANHHTVLFKKRAMYARHVWESIILLSCTEPNYLTIPMLESIKSMASFKLRKTEIEIMTFQLTCGMIGLSIADQKDLYHCACLFYLTTIFIANRLLPEKKSLNQRHMYGELIRSKPMTVDSPKDLAIQIDRQILTLHVFLTKGGVNDEDVDEVAKRLKQCICSFDKVAKIL